MPTALRQYTPRRRTLISLRVEYAGSGSVGTVIGAPSVAWLIMTLSTSQRGHRQDAATLPIHAPAASSAGEEHAKKQSSECRETTQGAEDC
jgi:hypothetical protein